MTSPYEALNNAIVEIDWLTPGSPKGVKRAVAELAAHWVKWWDSDERKLGNTAAGKTLQRYAEWYARAWAIVPADVRAKVPAPAEIDTSWTALQDAAIRQITNAYDTKPAADVVKEAARELRDEIANVHDALISDVVVLGIVAVAVLMAYGSARRAPAY